MVFLRVTGILPPAAFAFYPTLVVNATLYRVPIQKSVQLREASLFPKHIGMCYHCIGNFFAYRS